MFTSIILSTIFFTIIGKKLSNIKSIDTTNYLISTFHALGCILISYLYLNNKINEDQYISLTPFTIAYSIYDTFFMYFFMNTKNLNFMIMHHFMIIYVNYWLIQNRDLFVLKMLAINYLTEISTPFLNLSMYLYYKKNKKNKFFNTLLKISNYSLIITYFLFRVILGFYLIWLTAFYNYLFYLQLLMTSLNIYWFKKLLKKAQLI